MVSLRPYASQFFLTAMRSGRCRVNMVVRRLSNGEIIKKIEEETEKVENQQLLSRRSYIEYHEFEVLGSHYNRLKSKNIYLLKVF